MYLCEKKTKKLPVCCFSFQWHEKQNVNMDDAAAGGTTLRRLHADALKHQYRLCLHSYRGSLLLCSCCRATFSGNQMVKFSYFLSCLFHHSYCCCCYSLTSFCHCCFLFPCVGQRKNVFSNHNDADKFVSFGSTVEDRDVWLRLKSRNNMKRFVNSSVLTLSRG